MTSPLNIDWQNRQSYEPLLHADRSLLAWEWLRRDPDYRAAAMLGSNRSAALEVRSPQSFGLVRYEDPDASVPNARPVWRSEVNPQVLLAEPGADHAANCTIDFGRIWHLAHVVTGDEADHLLLSDGLRTIRVDAPLGVLSACPAALSLRVRGLIVGDLPVLALRRLLALGRYGRFARSLHPPEARAQRWITQLRAHDALEGGAGLREIAEELLGRPASGPAWRSRDPSLRSQAQRLVRSARRFADGGFRSLLSP